jgi:glutamyl-Q tRNA(Asp) synthetase
MSYVGRFAPSPTGPLHLGSLLAAAASFLHAREAQGRWLVRIEDIDPPREAPGAADEILRTLDAMDLHWDGPVVYQSSRLAHYRSVSEALLRQGLAFRCSCSRKTLRKQGEPGELGPPYPGTCRERRAHSGATAVRVRVEPGVISFDDELQGLVRHDLAELVGDYVIYRKDDLPAYHLAVVLDDAEQGITHIVRGRDLLLATCVHRHLQRVVGARSPQYRHFPVLTDAAGRKLSKQQGAPPVDASRSGDLASEVLRLLGFAPTAEILGASPSSQWLWAVEHWQDAQASPQTTGPSSRINHPNSR